MDLNALRVFNELHNLKITEKEFGDIEEEQKNCDRTGLYIRTIKKGHAICVSHDDKHEIIIKELKQKYPTPSRIILKTLVLFEKIPTQIYSLHKITQYRSNDSEVKYLARNLEELKDKIIDRFKDKNYELGVPPNYYRYNGDGDEEKKMMRRELLEEQLDALFWLFSENKKEFEENVKYARPNMSRIIKVFERKNKRIALIQRHDDYEKRRGIMSNQWTEKVDELILSIKSFKPSNQEYNYVDVNREIYFNERVGREIWVSDDLHEKCGAEELQVITEKYDDDYEGFILMNADEYNKGQTSVRLAIMSAKRKSLEDEAKKRLIQSLEEQFSKGKVVRKGITITNNYLECKGTRMTNHRIGEYVALNQVHLLSEPDFNKIVKDFLLWLLNVEHINNYYSGNEKLVCGFKGKEKILINNIIIVIESKGNNLTINNYRIKKDDAKEVILKATTHTDQESFDEYLKMCGKINLTLQKALSEGGLTFTLKINETPNNSLKLGDKEMIIGLKLRRDKNTNYAVINGKEYVVKDSKALLELDPPQNYYKSYLERTIKQLYKAIKGITPKEIGELIRTGVKEAEEIRVNKVKEEKLKVAKSKKLLEHSISISKAKKISGGFLVKGISGTKYTVANNLATYVVKTNTTKVRNDEDEYVCIVDLETNTDTEWGLNDALAKRLLMLRHDKKIADEVYTIKNKLGKNEEVEI